MTTTSSLLNTDEYFRIVIGGYLRYLINLNTIDREMVRYTNRDIFLRYILSLVENGKISDIADFIEKIKVLLSDNLINQTASLIFNLNIFDQIWNYLPDYVMYKSYFKNEYPSNITIKELLTLLHLKLLLNKIGEKFEYIVENMKCHIFKNKFKKWLIANQRCDSKFHLRCGDNRLCIFAAFYEPLCSFLQYEAGILDEKYNNIVNEYENGNIILSVNRPKYIQKFNKMCERQFTIIHINYSDILTKLLEYLIAQFNYGCQQIFIKHKQEINFIEKFVDESFTVSFL